MSLAWSKEVAMSSAELLEAHARVGRHVYGYVNSLSLTWALQLDIPNIIYKHGKPMTLSQLVNALGINKAKSFGMYRVMRVLVHSKIFTQVQISCDDKTTGYWLTPTSRILLKNEPLSVASMANPNFTQMVAAPLNHLVEWLQDDCSTAFETVHGKTIWEKASQDPSLNQVFNEAMASDSRSLTSVLVKEFKHIFEGLTSMVDVAGGTGFVSKSIAKAIPGLKCTVLDLPHVVAGLEGNECVTYVAGDMFEFVPSADAVFLKWMLHDWSDEECISILKKCKEAIPSKENGGKLIIVEMVVDENHEEVETQLSSYLLLMALMLGKERTEKEYASIFLEAGFSSYTITHGLGSRSLIEVYP